MNRLEHIILLLLFLVPGLGWAQLDPVSRSLVEYQQKNFPKAQSLIDEAIGVEPFSQEARTWYFRGFIYKDLYKENRNTALGHQHRNESIRSFQKTIELDTANEFIDDSKKSLNYLASTIYNDAAIAVDTNNFDIAEPYYEQYKKLMKQVTPGVDFTGRDIEFKLYLASKYALLFDDTNSARNEEIGKEIIRLYNEVLALDSNNVSANYNMAIHYYNQGVYFIDNTDFEQDLEQLFAIQEKVINLFTTALPFMLKAYELDPDRTATLEGLSGIYYSLSDMEKSEFYKQKLEALKNGN